MKIKNEHKQKKKALSQEIEPNLFLKIWLGIHIIAIVITIFFLGIFTIFAIFFSGDGLALLILVFTTPFLVDACLQLPCVINLWSGGSKGYRSLMILFVLRVVSLLVLGTSGIGFLLLNVFDAFLLWKAVKKSKVKPEYLSHTSEQKKKKHPTGNELEAEVLAVKKRELTIDPKMAKEYLDRALTAHIETRDAEAQQWVIKAFHYDPSLCKDQFAVGLAAEITGLSREEAVDKLLGRHPDLQDKNVKH